MAAQIGGHPGPIAIVTPTPVQRLRETETAAAKVTPVWKTVLVDSIGLVLVVWSIPVAIVLVGTPIVLTVALVMALIRWSTQP